MKYISTRGQAAPVDFVSACLAGLAPDGGLYVPESWPQIAPARDGAAYVDVAARVISAFAGDALDPSDVQAMCARAYASFSHSAVAPLTQTGANQWMMELHHGPTLAFKDVAMQLIAQLYEALPSARAPQRAANSPNEATPVQPRPRPPSRLSLWNRPTRSSPSAAFPMTLGRMTPRPTRRPSSTQALRRQHQHLLSMSLATMMSPR